MDVPRAIEYACSVLVALLIIVVWGYPDKTLKKVDGKQFRNEQKIEKIE